MHNRGPVFRDTFHRYTSAVDENGLDALFDKNRVDEDTGAAVVEYAIQESAHEPFRVSNELRKRDVFISPCGVRSI